MEINFTKPNSDQVLSCKRKDGSATWKHIIPFFISHELCHVAVETTVPLKNAFFGMVAAGIDIGDFDLSKEQRNFQLSEEAILAEHLVNLLTIEFAQGEMGNFLEILSAIYDEQVGTGLHKIINEEKLKEIRSRFNELVQQWGSLPENNTMTLLFEE